MSDLWGDEGGGFATLLLSDVFTGLRYLAPESVDFVMTSPPFLAQRKYLPDDHPLASLEIGDEDSPATFVSVMLAVAAELRRVLAPHGSIAIELGDTFSGSGGAGGDYAPGGLREGQPGGWRQRTKDGYPLAKCLTMTPEAVRMGLAYGFNPLTGEESPAGRWRVRNVVRWVRPNPSPGATGDRFKTAVTEMLIAAPASDRYWDEDAVRVGLNPREYGIAGSARTTKNVEGREGYRAGTMPVRDFHPLGSVPLDWWSIPVTPFVGSHFATYPLELCRRPVLAMTPPRVCVECGRPSVRQTSFERPDGEGFQPRVYEELGWSDCGHDAWRRGVVLDPFCGTGTTLAVATGCGRDAIGIDLDERNVPLVYQRVGPLFVKGVIDLRPEEESA